jgi:hypothetical protein
MYKNVGFESSHQLHEFNKALCSTRASIRKYVKSVFIEFTDVLRYLGCVGLMLVMCPNITEIQSPEFTSDMFEQILNAYDQGVCRYLESLPKANGKFTEEDLKKYQDLTCKLRKTLTHVHMAHDETQAEESSLDQLTQFPKICRLTINLKRPSTLNYIGNYLDQFPKLKVLNVDAAKDLVLNNWTQEEFAACQYIRSCSLTMKTLTDTLLKFIIHAFANLDDLSIAMIETGFNTGINNIKKAMWVEFLCHIQNNLKTFKIPQIIIYNITDVLTSYFQTTDNLDQILEIKYLRGYSGSMPKFRMKT